MRRILTKKSLNSEKNPFYVTFSVTSALKNYLRITIPSIYNNRHYIYEIYRKSWIGCILGKVTCRKACVVAQVPFKEWRMLCYGL